MAMKVKLTKPIQAHNEQVEELEFRELATPDVCDYGYPQLIIQRDEGVAIEIRPKVIAQYISRLAGIPMSSVKSLAPADFDACASVVQGFFNPGGSSQ